MGIVERLKAWLSSGPEGSYRGPAVGWSHWGNPFPVAFGNGFQDGLTLDARGAHLVPVAYACVMATARAVASCPPAHKVIGAKGKHETSATSPASRLLRRPNEYQTWPQFIQNAVATELFNGEAFILIRRDERYAANALHLLARGMCSPNIAPDDGEVFYSIGTNPMLPAREALIVPARDVIHLRQYTPRHPLIGESSVTAAALALGINVALAGHQAAFFRNMARPSGVLSPRELLTADQMREIRRALDEQSTGANAGKVPVIGGGTTFSSMSITSQDAQLIEAQRMSIEDVARCFGVPLPVIGDLSHATMTNVEATINFWLATGLGSLLENLERSFDAGFNLGADEYIEFDERALLRMDYKLRVEALTKAIQGGVMSPNEAREGEGLPPVAGGDSVFLQKQMVSIDLLTQLNQAEIEAKNRPSAAPAAPVEEETDEDEEATDDEEQDEDEDAEKEKDADPEITKALVIAHRERMRRAA